MQAASVPAQELQAVVVSYLEQFQESVDKAVSSQAEAVGAIDSFLSEVIAVQEAIPADRFREVAALVSLEDRIDALCSRVTLVERRLDSVKRELSWRESSSSATAASEPA